MECVWEFQVWGMHTNITGIYYERVLDLINDSEIQCPVHGPKRIFFGGNGGGHWRRLTGSSLFMLTTHKYIFILDIK